jgi:RNA-binding protein
MTSTLSGAEKRALRARGQRLEATVRLGHAGLTEGWLRTLDEALSKDELVKVRFTDPAVDRKLIAPEVAEKSASELVALVGNVAVYFRRKKKGPAETEAEKG